MKDVVELTFPLVFRLIGATKPSESIPEALAPSLTLNTSTRLNNCRYFPSHFFKFKNVFSVANAPCSARRRPLLQEVDLTFSRTSLRCGFPFFLLAGSERGCGRFRPPPSSFRLISRASPAQLENTKRLLHLQHQLS